MRVDYRRHSIGRVMEPVHKLETQRDEQRQNQQRVWPDASQGYVAEVLGDVKANESNTDNQRCQNHAGADHGVRFLHLLIK